mmetsp:Transcript_4614/g.18384  ORF Transcript_4614/g.18384 Transcript_4614/m.18384 type:complete len:201 (+) Transcript_4614:179-781(+)
MGFQKGGVHCRRRRDLVLAGADGTLGCRGGKRGQQAPGQRLLQRAPCRHPGDAVPTLRETQREDICHAGPRRSAVVLLELLVRHQARGWVHRPSNVDENGHAPAIARILPRAPHEVGSGRKPIVPQCAGPAGDGRILCVVVRPRGRLIKLQHHRVRQGDADKGPRLCVAKDRPRCARDSQAQAGASHLSPHVHGSAGERE